MARFTPDGATKVTWVPGANAIEDPQAPSVVELNGPSTVDLECYLTKDGLSVTTEEETVEDGVLCETFDAELPGTTRLAGELTMVRDDIAAQDVAWNAFSTRKDGWIVIRDGIDTTLNPDWRVGDRAQVYKVRTGDKRPAPTASNENSRFMVTLYGRLKPRLDAVVTAS